MQTGASLFPRSATPMLDLRVLRAHAKGDEGMLAQYIARRNAGEPIAHIVGTKGFWTLDLQVTRDVLTPRPDSETILDTLLQLRPDKKAALKILDLGTGSGCLILSALSEYENAVGDAVDISEAALNVARNNAKKVASSVKRRAFSGHPERSEGSHDVSGDSSALPQNDRVVFYHGSWCEPLPAGKKYDVILTNPPYIPTEDIASLAVDVKNFEPHLALDGGKDGLECYRTLAKQIHLRMVNQAIALIEVGAGQAHEVAAIMQQSGLAVLTTKNDLAGIARVVVCEKPSAKQL